MTEREERWKRVELARFYENREKARERLCETMAWISWLNMQIGTLEGELHDTQKALADPHAI